MSTSILCDCCNLVINPSTTIYKGFDLTFCSPICRTKKVTELNKLKAKNYITNSPRYILEQPNIKRQQSYSSITIPTQTHISAAYSTSNISNKEIYITSDSLDKKARAKNNFKSMYYAAFNYLCFVSGISFTICIYNLQVIYNEFYT